MHRQHDQRRRPAGSRDAQGVSSVNVGVLLHARPEGETLSSVRGMQVDEPQAALHRASAGHSKIASGVEIVAIDVVVRNMPAGASLGWPS